MRKINEISLENSEFLQRLMTIDKPPKTLFYQGILPDALPTVAIVGSRKPTAYGKSVTLKLASELARRGVIIVSGLAIGHDSLAAAGALDGGGVTIGVVGAGLDNTYPRATWQIRERLLDSGGAVISEYPIGAKVYPNNFLARNRIISGLADIVIVVEAGEKSGTMNTAAHALAQNRELMAVPGNITSPLSVGCNRLISQGATPVLGVDDVLEKLRAIYAAKISQTPKSATEIFLKNLEQEKSSAQRKIDPAKIRGNNEAETRILRALAGGASDGDEIMRNSKISPAEFSVALTMLEISGKIAPLGANRWTLK